MRIEIENTEFPGHGDTIRQVWAFTASVGFGGENFILQGLEVKERKTKRHKWQATAKWSPWDRRFSSIERPTEVPKNVRKALYEEFLRQSREIPVFIGSFMSHNKAHDSAFVP